MRRTEPQREIVVLKRAHQPQTVTSSDSHADRRHIGGDFYLETLDPGSSEELRVDVGFEHPEWRPRFEGSAARAAFPGSAIQVDDRWYEVVRIETAAGTPPRTSYYLEPWDDAATVRNPYELTPEACTKATREHWRGKRRRATGEVLTLFPFLLGMLPAEDQRWIERRFGVPATRNSAISAVINLAVSTLVGFVVFAFFLGHDFGGLNRLIERLMIFIPLFAYLGVESMYRLPAAASGEPAGSLPVALPVTVVRWLATRLFAAEKRSADARRTFRGRAGKFAGARDQVNRLSGEYDLEVVSLLPKEHWTANATGIYYRGEAYLLAERSVTRTPDGVRHRFLLQKPEHAAIFNAVTEYRPEEVRDVYLAHRRLDAAMWVETFAVLWGFLDHETQIRIGRVYDYDPWKITRRTIVGTAALAALAFIDATADMVRGVAAPDDGIKFFGGCFLIWEAALRWRSYQRGEIRSSVLGIPLRPLTRRALRWE